MGLKALKSVKLNKKYLWSFFLVVLCIDLLITGMLFALYSSIQVQKATEYSVAQLEQACSATDILYNSMKAVVNQVIADSETASFLLSKETNRLQEAGVGIKLRAWRTSNPYMRYITLYNADSRRFVSSAYAGYDTDLDVEEFYHRLDGNPYVCYLRPIGADYNVQKTKTAKAYTFVFPVQMKADASTCLVIIDVNDSYFNQALSPIRISGEDQQVLLQDGQGNLIAGMTAKEDQDSFTVNLQADNAFWDLTQHREEESGSFSGRAMNLDRFVAFAGAEEAGWTIYNILPYRTVLSGLGTLTALTITLTLVTLVFGYLLSRKVSSYLYAPIKTLYENYVSGESQKKKGNELALLSDAFSEMYSKADRLEQGLISSFQQSKNMYLTYLLSGETEKVNSSLSIYQRLEIDLAAPAYRLILIECVPPNGTDANLFICYYALENITRELLAPFGGMEFLRVGENRFAVLLYLREGEAADSVQEPLSTVVSTMNREFHIDVTICVGGKADSWANINLAYEQACIALNARSASHYGQVFLAAESPQAMSSELYFNSIHSKMAEHVRNQDTEACAGEFDQALTALRDVSFKSAKTWFRHALMSVLDDFSMTFERDDEEFAVLMEQLAQIDSCQNVRSLKAVVLSFLSSLSQRLSNVRKSSNQDAAARAKEYIDKNYSDPNLSLRMLAEKVGLSPAYLGKTFTTVTTFTFNDYLNNVRTAKAAELLCSTRLPIGQISETVGILNTNYFYSVFKKRYGTTPSAYRRESRARFPSPEREEEG